MMIHHHSSNDYLHHTNSLSLSSEEMDEEYTNATATIDEEEEDEEDRLLSLKERLVWVRYKRLYWWPALLYQSYSELQSEVMEDELTTTTTMKAQFAMSIMQKGGKAIKVARLLGKSSSLEIVETTDGSYHEFYSMLPTILPKALDKRNYIHGKKQDTLLFLDFHRALDHVEAIIEDDNDNDSNEEEEKTKKQYAIVPTMEYGSWIKRGREQLRNGQQQQQEDMYLSSMTSSTTNKAHLSPAPLDSMTSTEALPPRRDYNYYYPNMKSRNDAKRLSSSSIIQPHRATSSMKYKSKNDQTMRMRRVIPTDRRDDDSHQQQQQQRSNEIRDKPIMGILERKKKKKQSNMIIRQRPVPPSPFWANLELRRPPRYNNSKQPKSIPDDEQRDVPSSTKKLASWNKKLDAHFKKATAEKEASTRNKSTTPTTTMNRGGGGSTSNKQQQKTRMTYHHSPPKRLDSDLESMTPSQIDQKLVETEWMLQEALKERQEQQEEQTRLPSPLQSTPSNTSMIPQSNRHYSLPSFDQSSMDVVDSVLNHPVQVNTPTTITATTTAAPPSRNKRPAVVVPKQKEDVGDVADAADAAAARFNSNKRPVVVVPKKKESAATTTRPNFNKRRPPTVPPQQQQPKKEAGGARVAGFFDLLEQWLQLVLGNDDDDNNNIDGHQQQQQWKQPFPTLEGDDVVAVLSNDIQKLVSTNETFSRADILRLLEDAEDDLLAMASTAEESSSSTADLTTTTIVSGEGGSRADIIKFLQGAEDDLLVVESSDEDSSTTNTTITGLSTLSGGYSGGESFWQRMACQ